MRGSRGNRRILPRIAAPAGYGLRLLTGRIRHRLTALRAARATKPRPIPAGHLGFRCNICGAYGSAPEHVLRDREAPSCRVCGANLRFRAVIAALQLRLLGGVTPLRTLPRQPDRMGLGMSDASVYANWLREKFAYTNTFFHTHPLLDIQHPDPRFLGRQDFVISSDVLEHVAPPVECAFANLHALLKPGGLLVMTVPYDLQQGSREHFPELHEFRIEGEGAARRLVNRTQDGREQVFGDLCFHGGDGATLEMRVFGLPHLLRTLEAAGFTDIRVHDDALPAWGIFPDVCSRPITALAGPVGTASTSAMR